MIEIKLAPIENSIVELLERVKTPLTSREIADGIDYCKVSDWHAWERVLERLVHCGFILNFNGKYGPRRKKDR